MNNILVSGGSRGLGAALVEHLSHRHNVVTFSRGWPAQYHPNATYLRSIDARNIEDLDTLQGCLKDCDGLVNNIGIAYDGLLATQGEKSIHELLEVNLFSVIYLTKLYIRSRLAQRKGGSVVFISSITSLRGYSGLAVYSATKGAINSLAQSLSREMGGRGFRFNVVAPGYFESDLSRNLSDEKKRQIIRRTPLGRLATPGDICPLVEFLLSDEAAFITGQLITVDGGLTV